jgi:RimK family alpha-L-glutamate ligase
MGGKLALVADRISWEERQMIISCEREGLTAEWVNDESLCLGGCTAARLEGYDIALMRSRSYTRGGLLATAVATSGITTLNAPAAIHACENKLTLRCLLRQAEISVPDFRLVTSRKDFTQALEEIGLPAVLKPVFGGMGKRVFLIREVDTAQSLYDYIEDLGHAFEQACLVERFLGDRSLRCFVVGRRLVAAAEFRSRGDEWRSNAAIGSHHSAIVCEQEIQDIVDRVVHQLGAGIYGIDLFPTPSGYVVNEVNHAPGFRAVSTATGVDIAKHISRHLHQVLR